MLPLALELSSVDNPIPAATGVNVKSQRFLPGLALFSLALSLPLAAQEAPAFLGKHQGSAQDTQAIEHLLATYTSSVGAGDEAAFSAILLNDQVPFMSTDNLSSRHKNAQHPDTRDYRGFRQAIFESGKHYEQHFYNVHIEQDGPLAQASLDFVTIDKDSHQGGYGWKTLQLLKVQGQWKIASEFYTAYALPRQSG